MAAVIKRLTLTAYDDNTVEISDAQGFLFPPTLVVVMDDFNGVGIFNAGPWSTQEVIGELSGVARQIATGEARHYKPGAKPDGRP